MLSPVYNSMPDQSARPVGNQGERTENLVSSRPDADHLDHSIRVSKYFFRRTVYDFNNLIAVMQGFSSILQNRLKDDEANRGMAELIEASTGEALKLTYWFSTLANNNPVELIELELSNVLDKFLTTSSADLPAEVQVLADLGNELPTPLCDEEQLERIC